MECYRTTCPYGPHDFNDSAVLEALWKAIGDSLVLKTLIDGSHKSKRRTPYGIISSQAMTPRRSKKYFTAQRVQWKHLRQRQSCFCLESRVYWCVYLKGTKAVFMLLLPAPLVVSMASNCVLSVGTKRRICTFVCSKSQTKAHQTKVNRKTRKSLFIP
jgi:hypothetical protein